MSKNPHVSIVVVVLQYRFVEIEGEIAVAIFLHTNVQIEAMEYTSHCAVRFAMQWKEQKEREEAKPWLDEQASEEQARQQYCRQGVLILQARRTVGGTERSAKRTKIRANARKRASEKPKRDIGKNSRGNAGASSEPASVHAGARTSPACDQRARTSPACKMHSAMQKCTTGNKNIIVGARTRTGDLLHQAAQDKSLRLRIAFVKNATADLFNKGKHGKIPSN